MKPDIYQVDAFAEEVFRGNPAAVMPLEAWLDDAVMQSIAIENNLSETAFFVRNESRGAGCYDLRWFTPEVEVDLCGHATLASSHVIWTKLGETADTLTFATRSGDLLVSRGKDGLFEMDFPTSRPEKQVEVSGLAELLGVTPVEIFDNPGLMAVLPSEVDVKDLDFKVSGLEAVLGSDFKAALIVTAAGSSGVDCVSRFFAPYAGIDEDPVTGSIHTSIIPYWADKLGKKDIIAHQASRRGGMLYCTDASERTIIRGRCVDYMAGVVTL